MTFRLIADCRLTANSPPTEISDKPYKTWVIDKNSVGSCHLNFCSFRLKITKEFQAFASVGKSAATSLLLRSNADTARFKRRRSAFHHPHSYPICERKITCTIMTSQRKF